MACFTITKIILCIFIINYWQIDVRILRRSLRRMQIFSFLRSSGVSVIPKVLHSTASSRVSLSPKSVRRVQRWLRLKILMLLDKVYLLRSYRRLIHIWRLIEFRSTDMILNYLGLILTTQFSLCSKKKITFGHFQIRLGPLVFTAHGFG